MTEPVTTRRDITRPLDECVPVTPAEAPPLPLRRAIPDQSAWDPATPRASARLAAISSEATPVPQQAAGSTGAGRTRPEPRAGRRAGAWVGRVLTAPGRGARTVAAWSRRPSGRLVLPSVLVTTMVAVAIAAGALVMPQPAATGETGGAGAPVPPPGASEAPAAPSARPSVDAGSTVTLGSRPADVLRGWAQQMSTRTGIPVVAMQAYGYAELVVTQTTPGCRLTWTTLAAIGLAESHHGSTGSATLQSDGRAWPEIIGPPLDGQGDRKLIPDTDGGRLDGDPVYDRAVGPMQFLPQTWRAQRIDASGDGVADPHNMHDAALAAANYLCGGARDLATAQDWWAGVLAYNDVQAYAQQVFDAANDYGRRSR